MHLSSPPEIIVIYRIIQNRHKESSFNLNLPNTVLDGQENTVSFFTENDLSDMTK